MFSLNSSPLALKRKLRLSTTYTILVVFFLFTLYITSCEARHLRFDGGKYSSNDKSSLSSKDATEVGDTKKQTRSSFMVHDTGKKARVIGSSTSDQSAGAKGAASVDLSGGNRNTRHIARVLQQLPHRKHRDDQGIHLDYAQPRTRSDSSRGSNGEQLGSKATTVYTAGTLVAMDYPAALAAPAVHNR